MIGITRAPDIHRPGLTWVNVEPPLSLADADGRLVILDFWTFCCINCFQVLPTLKRIEEEYPDDVLVIGVHSPKFPHERDLNALKRAIARYDVRHPVIHDPSMTLWRDYQIHAWPTLVFISPDGFIIGDLPGEPHPDLLVRGIGDMIEQFWNQGEMDPQRIALTPLVEAGGRLRFPGKIKPCPSRSGEKLWAIADTGHNQIVLIDDGGIETARFGTGQVGFHNGTSDATFNGPEGLACDEDFIWVADTRNHAIRRIDRSTGAVVTVAGNGLRGLPLRHPSQGEVTSLASPWDLALVEGILYFTNTGCHQICAFDTGNNQVRPVAGTGQEDLSDGTAQHARLAQPSGLAPCPQGAALYFADSETSAVRKVLLGEDPAVETLVGTGLFDFGHTNGNLSEARMQHPMGLAAVDGRVYVADSYNSAIRVIDIARGLVSDLPLKSCGGGCAPTFEPAGVVADGPDRLLVSDTNNHRIMEIRVSDGETRTWFG